MKAACFLKTQGYQILERNYRCKKGEIDLIAREGQYLVFVEVKYRSTNESGLPEEAVDLRKQRQISRVAAWYLTEKGLDIYTPCRFDVVAIEGEEIRLPESTFSDTYPSAGRLHFFRLSDLSCFSLLPYKEIARIVCLIS